MATTADANKLGFATPQGSDRIEYGDNRITQNAQATVDLFRSAATYADGAARSAATAAIAQLKANTLDEMGRQVTSLTGLTNQNADAIKQANATQVMFLNALQAQAKKLADVRADLRANGDADSEQDAKITALQTARDLQASRIAELTNRLNTQGIKENGGYYYPDTGSPIGVKRSGDYYYPEF